MYAHSAEGVSGGHGILMGWCRASYKAHGGTDLSFQPDPSLWQHFQKDWHKDITCLFFQPTKRFQNISEGPAGHKLALQQHPQSAVNPISLQIPFSLFYYFLYPVQGRVLSVSHEDIVYFSLFPSWYINCLNHSKMGVFIPGSWARGADSCSSCPPHYQPSALKFYGVVSPLSP